MYPPCLKTVSARTLAIRKANYETGCMASDGCRKGLCQGARPSWLAVMVFLCCCIVLVAPSDDVSKVPQHECEPGMGDDCPAAAFAPTDQWQKVLPGQPVPDSCDVKVDLATGQEFARTRPSVSTGGVAVDETNASVPDLESPEARAETAAKMYHILMGLPEPPAELKSEQLHAMDPLELEALVRKLWARRQEYLHETYEQHAETEQEILEGNLNMLKMLKSPGDDAELLGILDEMEYLVAQTDNARTVANLEGWPTIVDLLGAPTDDVAKAAAWVVGTAVKLDEQVQNNALDAAVMRPLVSLLSQDGSDLARSLGLRTKAVFALGQLLRGNRRAQRIFLTAKGAEMLHVELSRASAGDKQSAAMQAKLLALISDLLGDADVLPSLASTLSAPTWCEGVAEAAVKLGTETSRQANELAMKAMIALRESSRTAACDSAIAARATTWTEWRNAWDALAQLPGDDGEYPEQLAEIADKLLEGDPR